MTQNIILGLTVIMPDEDVARAVGFSEKMHRLAMGFAIEGVYTSLSFTREASDETEEFTAEDKDEDEDEDRKYGLQ